MGSDSNLEVIQRVDVEVIRAADRKPEETNSESSTDDS